jgi:hypothetical protein
VYVTLPDCYPYMPQDVFSCFFRGPWKIFFRLSLLEKQLVTILEKIFCERGGVLERRCEGIENDRQTMTPE